MAVIAILDIMLGAKTDGFDAGMNKAQNAVKQLAQSVAGGAPGIMSFLGGLAGGALGAGIVELGKSVLSLVEHVHSLAAAQIEALYSAEKLSERLGLGRGELAAMKIAAAHTGVSVEQLTRSMEHLGTQVAEAAKGTNASAIATFDRLGLSFAKLSQMSRPEQIAAVGQALEKIGNQYEREDLAKKIFGRGFGEVRMAVKELGEDFDGLKSRAAGLGLGISKEDAAHITEAKVAMENLGLVWEGVKNQVATSLAPVFKDVADLLSDYLPNAIENAKIAFAPLLSVLKLLADDLHAVAVAHHYLVESFNKFKSGLANLNIPTWLKKMLGMAGESADVGDSENKTRGVAGILASANTTQGPAAADEGSKEAFQVIAQARAANPVVEKLDDVQNVLTQLVDLTKYANDMLKAATAPGADM